MTKISALIFSMNRIENIVKLSEKIHKSVDEIVIVDSSNKKNHELLKEKLKFTMVYWLPPIGIVELYHQIGINLCRYDWIFQLDDDEDPNSELISELRNLPKKYSAKVFLIDRIEKKGNRSKQIRFFHKDFVKPTGIIHWALIIKTDDVVKLDNRYFIIHHCTTDFKRLKKYTMIEAYQWGYKVNYALKSSRRLKFLRSVFISIRRINEVFAYWLFANLYIICYFYFYLLYRDPSYPLTYSIAYPLYISLEINGNFFKCLEVWKSMDNKTAIEWLGLEDTQNLVGLSAADGLENFKRCIFLKSKVASSHE